MDAHQVHFQQLLKDLISTDNDTRWQAQETYMVMLTLDVKVEQLLAAIHNGELQEECRCIAAVLLRRKFTSKFMEYYDELPQVAQGQFLERILLAVQLEGTPNLRSKICEAVAVAARILIDRKGRNQWPDFQEFIFRCAKSQNATWQEAALRILASVPEMFEQSQIRQYVKLAKRMFRESLRADADSEVQFQAVRAVATFVLLYDKNAHIHRHFSELLPRMIVITEESVLAQRDQSLVKMLIDITGNCPHFLRPHLEGIFAMCIRMLSSTGVEDQWRHLLLEVMVSLSENAAPMVRRKAKNYIADLIPLILQMMADLDDDDHWAGSDAAEEDTSENNIIAVSSLDRLANGLGGNMILAPILRAMRTMLSHRDWKQRHAALIAIFTIGEGCRHQMEKMLDEIMNSVLPFLTDAHPRVRYTVHIMNISYIQATPNSAALELRESFEQGLPDKPRIIRNAASNLYALCAACNGLQKMSSDFEPVFEDKFHRKVIPDLLSLLDDVEDPRVQANAGAALVAFSVDCPKQILTRYLDRVINKLEGVLNAKFNKFVEKDNKLVLEQVVSAIAAVANTCENEFAIYYDRLMPHLKYIVQNANMENVRVLRGKTVECVSYMGLTVGGEKSIPDAKEVLDILLTNHPEGDLPDDDPQNSYLISAWARMCKILGKQFEQYLPLVMDLVMRTAAVRPEVALLDNDEVEELAGEEEWTFVTFGDHQKFAICEARMEDKAKACEMLLCFARELKQRFAEYAEEVIRLMVPMLSCCFHKGVRSAVAESLPYLLECVKIKGPQYLAEMWPCICSELIQAIEIEVDPDVQCENLQSLAKSIEILDPNGLSEQIMNDILKIISNLMAEHFEQAEKRAQARNEEDYDDGVEAILAEEDASAMNLLAKITDVLEALFLTYKANFLTYFDKIAPKFIQLLDSSRPWAERHCGLRTFHSLIEYCGKLCIQYQQIFTEPMLEYITDRSPEVRQAAAYGWGLLAQFGGEQFAPTCARAIPLLAEMVTAPNSRDQENINPTENAISAVTKILKYNSSALQNKDEIINLWFSWLPVTEDKEEASHVYGYLCDLIQSNHPAILGNSNQNVPRIVAIIADAFSVGVVLPISEVGTRMVGIVKQMDGIAALAASPVATEVVDRLAALEKENTTLRELVESLKKCCTDTQKRVQTLETRIQSLSISQPHSTKAASPPVKKEEKPKNDDEDDGVDLFGSDSEDDEEANAIREKRLADYHAKKSKKPALIAKSSVVLDIKPWDDETDLAKMEQEIRKIGTDGLLWGASKLQPVAFGIKKLVLSCVVEDEKVSIDWLTEEIEKLEDYVQSVDVAAFNKI